MLGNHFKQVLKGWTAEGLTCPAFLQGAVSGDPTTG